MEIVEYISNSLLDVFGMDMAYFEQSVPVTKNIFAIVMAVGWALLLGNLVFQSMRSMAAGLGFDAEDPKILFARTAVFSFLLLASRQICDIGLGITATVINMLQVPSSVQIPVPEETTFSIGASWLLVLIIGFIVMWQVVRLFFEVGERYVVTAVLAILSPLAFAMGGSKSTEDIFKGWVRMFGSMCLMMVFNVIFLKMLISALAIMPDGTEVLPWMILVMGIARVARKIDGIITRIGLNPAITGEGLGRGGIPGMLAFNVARSLGSTVVKSIGRNGGRGATGGGSRTPPGGAGGGGAAGRGYGGRQTFGGRGTRTGHASSAAYAASSQQSQSSTTAGTAAAQSAAQASQAQTDTQSTQHTAAHTHSAAQAGERSGAAATPGMSGSSRTAGTPGTPGAQQSASRRTSAQQGQGGWSPRPSFVSREAAVPGAPGRPGMAGMGTADTDAKQTPMGTSQTDAAPRRAPTTASGAVPPGMAGKQAAAGPQQPETTRFTAAPPSARQEAAGKPGGTRSVTSRQSGASTSQADVSTRQSSVSTQQTTRTGAAPTATAQSRPQTGAVSLGTAGMPADQSTERPTRGGQPGFGSPRPAPPADPARTEARPTQASRTPPPVAPSAPSRPTPARQESRLTSGAGAAHQAPRPSGGMAGKQTTGQAERPGRDGKSATPSAFGQSPAKTGGKRAAPGGQASPQQKNRPPHRERGGGTHGK